MSNSSPPAPAPTTSPARPRRFGEAHWFADDDLLALAFAADGTLWSVEQPGVLQHWDSTGRMLGRFELTFVETLWVFDAQAKWLASGADELVIYDVATHEAVQTLEQPSWVTAVAFHPTERHVATGHDDGIVRIWNLANPDEFTELEHHEEPISALAFTSDGQLLAAASEDRTISVWQHSDAKLLQTLKGHTDRISALAWKPETKTLVSGGWDTTARLWNIDTGEPIMLLNAHADQLFALAFSPDGNLLAVADSAAAIHVWSEAAPSTALHVLPGDHQEIQALTFSHDGKRLAVGGVDRVIHVWDPVKGEQIGGAGRQRDHRIALGSDGLLASTATGTQLRCWDTTTGRTRAPDGLVPMPIALAASPDGRWIAVSNKQPDSRLHVWDNESKGMHPPAEGPRAPITCVAFSPDSNTIATCCRTDGTAWLWDPTNGEPKLIIPDAVEGCMIEAIAFHPNGIWLACGGIDFLATGGSNGAVTIWNVEDRERLVTIDRSASSLAFNGDGSRLAVAGPESELAVFDVGSQEMVFEISGTNAEINSVAFSPDGRWLVAGCDDHTLRVWESQTGQSISVTDFDTPILSICFDASGDILYTGNGNTTCFAVPFNSLLES